MIFIDQERKKCPLEATRHFAGDTAGRGTQPAVQVENLQQNGEAGCRIHNRKVKPLGPSWSGFIVSAITSDFGETEVAQWTFGR